MVMAYARFIALILGQFANFGRLPFIGVSLAFHWQTISTLIAAAIL